MTRPATLAYINRAADIDQRKMVPGQFTRSTCTEKPSSHGNHLNRFGRRNDWVPYWANASAGILVHQQRFALWPTLLSVAPLVQCVVCRLSSVTFCIATKRYVLAKNCLKERIGNQGQKVDFGGSPSYFYFRFRLYGHRDGRFCLSLPVQPSNRYWMVEMHVLAPNHVRIVHCVKLIVHEMRA